MSETASMISPERLYGLFTKRLDESWVDLPEVTDRQHALDLIRTFETQPDAKLPAAFAAMTALRPITKGYSKIANRKRSWLRRRIGYMAATGMVLTASMAGYRAWRRAMAEIRTLGAIVSQHGGRPLSSTEITSSAIQLYLEPNVPPVASIDARTLVPKLGKALAGAAIKREADEDRTTQRIDGAFKGVTPDPWAVPERTTV